MTQVVQAAPVSRAVVRAMIDYARGKDYPSGVLGIRARVDSPKIDRYQYGEQSVVIVPCESALAVREALLDRPAGAWLVIITDRSEDDLGAGILAHFLWQRLRTPDPWQAVRQRFNATGVDSLLTTMGRNRDIAHGLLEATPADGWSVAPAGTLTRDHALGSVARSWLGVIEGPIDVLNVLGWTAKPLTPTKIADLRTLGNDALADATLNWISESAGPAAPPVKHLLNGGGSAEILPRGVVLQVLHDVLAEGNAQDHHAAEVALARISHWFPEQQVSRAALVALGRAATTVTTTLLTDRRTREDAERILVRADVLVREAQVEGLTESSDLLRSGLLRRWHSLADLMRDNPTSQLAAIERAWERVSGHALVDSDSHTVAFHAAVRLIRWLALQRDAVVGEQSLAALSRRQLDSDGWVDSALNDAAAGVDDAELGSGLAAVLSEVRSVRDQHDQEFAAALASGTADEVGAGPGYLEHDGSQVWLLERLVPDVVIPLAKRRPVLFLVLDGMSTGVATEVLRDVLDRPGAGWAEELVGSSKRRAAGIAVLPSITEASRASMLCGELTTGQQDRERRGYEALTRAHGLAGASLFHKKILDTTRLGFSLSDEVRSALDDVDDQQLVTCVLNTIDDALDRSDPAGTTWTADTVKHLRPLLERARAVGRTVVITADHGHIVERRLGTQKSHAEISSGRSRAAVGDAGVDEVRVSGPRVLKHGGEAILAVSERLRYGPLKAGYHGGAAPAEVVVPVVVLVPAEIAENPDIKLAPPQQPDWWSLAGSTAPAPLLDSTARATPSDADLPTLFDEPAAPSPVPAVTLSLGDAVVASQVYREQRAVAGRISLTDEQIGALINQLSIAPHGRLTEQQVAGVLSVPTLRTRFAANQASKLLNVEGYPVIRIDADGSTMILDESLLREQYGVSP